MKNESEQSFAVIVVGGGPTGMSAAMGFLEGRVSCLVINQGANLGGQLPDIPSSIVNLAGVSVNNGAALAEQMRQSFAQAQLAASTDQIKVTIEANCRVTKVEPGVDAVLVTIKRLENPHQTPEIFRAKYVLIATGYRVRKLPPPTPALDAYWLYDTDCLGDQLSQMSLAVLGGGDSALLKVIGLSPKVKHLHLVYRGKNFKGRPDLVTKLHNLPNCTVHMESEIVELLGGDKLKQVRLGKINGGASGASVIDVSAVIVKIGYEPNTELLEGLSVLDKTKHVIVDQNLRTTMPGLYAAGDIVNAEHARIATAVGNGMKAAGVIMQLLYKDH